MSDTNSEPVQPTDPNLLTGRVVIQASAGTGKTYSLTVLVVRHVAERDLTADQLLMVTFTNAATTELRDKTRDQARNTLNRLRNGDRSQPWMAPMMASEESISRAVTNLEAFLAHFDDATITTIHGFCQIILKKAGLQSPAPPSYVVRDNVDDIVLVSEESLSRALLLLLERAKLVVEPAGAAAFAAVMDNPTFFEPPVAVTLSGGNIDPLLLLRVIRHGLVAAGRYLTVECRLKDSPGSLAGLLADIGATQSNIVEVDHNRIDPHLGVDEVDIVVQMETRGEQHRDEVLRLL